MNLAKTPEGGSANALTTTVAAVIVAARNVAVGGN